MPPSHPLEAVHHEEVGVADDAEDVRDAVVGEGAGCRLVEQHVGPPSSSSSQQNLTMNVKRSTFELGGSGGARIPGQASRRLPPRRVRRTGGTHRPRAVPGSAAMPAGRGRPDRAAREAQCQRHAGDRPVRPTPSAVFFAGHDATLPARNVTVDGGRHRPPPLTDSQFRAPVRPMPVARQGRSDATVTGLDGTYGSRCPWARHRQ